MRCASLAAAAAVVVVNIFPDDDDDDDDLTPKQPPRSSHEEEEDKEIARRHAVALKEEDTAEDLLPKREAASFREMNICVFCARAWCSLVFVWVFPRGKFSSEVLKTLPGSREREREFRASSSSASPESSLFTTSGRGRVWKSFFRALAGHT